MRPLLLLAFVLTFSVASVQAASPPDWLKPLLLEDTAALAKKHSVIRLLDYEKVEYRTTDKARHLIRGAMRFNSIQGLRGNFASIQFNPDVSKVRSSKAWIVSPDGKKTERFLGTDFIENTARFGVYFWDSLRVLAFMEGDRLGVGGVLAWEFELDIESGIFDSTQVFSGGIPILHGIFEVIPCDDTTLQYHVNDPRVPTPTVIGQGGLRWETSHMPGHQGEPINGFIPKATIISARCISGKPETNATATWASLAQKTDGFMSPKIMVTPELKAKAEELTRGKKDRWDRVRALADFAQHGIAYLAVTEDTDSLAGYRPHPACDVLKNRYGDCKDKATLLCALLRATGDDGHVVLVYSGNPSVVQPDWPSARFNHAITAIPADADTPSWWPVVDTEGLGRLVIFDPTNPFMPLGVLPPEDQGGHALIVHPKGSLIRLPGDSPSYTGLTRNIEGKLDLEGNLSLKITENYLGSAGGNMQKVRETLRKEKYASLTESRFQGKLSLIKNLTWSDAWIPQEARYTMDINLTAERQARSLGKDKFLLSPDTLYIPIFRNEWKSDLDGMIWKTADALHEKAVITIPEGFTVLEMPKPWQAETHGITAKLNYRTEGNQIIFECELICPPSYFERPAFVEIRKMMESLQAAARRPFILQRPAI